MKAQEHLKGLAGPFEEAIASEEFGSALNIAGVYQDIVTREWAIQSYLRATQLAGEDHVHNSWYDVSALSDPEVLMDAVFAARAADVIVISVYAADELPLNLYAWIAAWLPRRVSRAGALAALVGVNEPLDPQSVRTIGYLQAVAFRGQLDFVPQSRRLTDTSSTAFNPIEESASADARSISAINEQRCFPYYHKGLSDV